MPFKHNIAAIICLISLTVVGPAYSATLGVAADYNVFVFGDFSHSSGDSEGNIAAGGNVTFSGGYHVAKNITGSNGARLVADGDITTNGGGIGDGQDGTIYTSGIKNNDPSFTYQKPIQPQNQVTFSTAETFYKGLSTSLSGLTANGDTENKWGQLFLTGTDASLNIFSVTAFDLTNTSTVQINAPTGSTVLINVSGTDQTFNGGQVQHNGESVDDAHPSKFDVLYNFYESDKVTLGGGKNPHGSILAVWADVTGLGAMDGHLIAQSFSGSTEFHDNIFDGNIPIDPVPLPAAFWLFGSAFGFLSVLSRLRKQSS